MGDMMNLENLNNEQREAVMITEGPLLVLAGAGSGKTRVLTTRVAYLVKEKGINPYNILAITFTNKAANEMKERIYNMLGEVAHYIQISTFHSFGLLILKENYKLLGYKNNFTILDSDDSLTVIKKVMKELNLDPKQYNPNAIRSKISGAKNELMGPDEYEKYANTDFEQKVVSVYKNYQNKLFVSNSVDFEDLLILPIKLFRMYPEILNKYQERFKYIMIDEYQDTNQAQYVLTKMISEKYKNICVVGDESQSIYSFRGSNYRNILNFEKDYPDAKVVLLEKNYRSTQTILNAANDVIKNNKQRKDKKLWTDNEEGCKVKYHRTIDEKEEAYYVVEQIYKLLEQDIPKKEIAVLYRTNAQSRQIEEALLRENIPYKVIGSFYFYNRKEIKDLIAYLKVIYNEYDDNSLLRIINVPKRGIGQKTIENLNQKALIEGKSIYEVIDSGKELEFKKLIEELKTIKDNVSLTELVESVLNKSGIKQELINEKTIEADIRLENLEEFKTITKEFEERNGIISLEEFLNEISLVSDIEEYKNNDDAITLMTVHSAKGLEFSYVFIVGLEEGLFPHRNSLFDINDIEEERRLCYVAITRAKKQLWLINARQRSIFGSCNFNQPSRFVNEINEAYLEMDDNFGNNTVFEQNYTDMVDNNVDYQFGETVIHDKFGTGVIVSIDELSLTIAFPHPYGIRKVIKGHKSIRKV